MTGKVTEARLPISSPPSTPKIGMFRGRAVTQLSGETTIGDVFKSAMKRLARRVASVSPLIGLGVALICLSNPIGLIALGATLVSSAALVIFQTFQPYVMAAMKCPGLFSNT